MSLANDIKNSTVDKNTFSDKELTNVTEIAKTITSGETSITNVARFLARNPEKRIATFGNKKVYLIMAEIRKALK